MDVTKSLLAVVLASSLSSTALSASTQTLEQRIKALEAQLSKPQTKANVPTASTQTEADQQRVENHFSPGKGFRIAETSFGVTDLSIYSYMRYLNQKGLDDTYTDSQGNVSQIDPRNDLQVQKVMLYFKGWVYDPKLNYVFYTWTSNTSQGDGAQVVVAGFMTYNFDPKFALSLGISGLPSTRSMEGGWPNFLKVDYRTISDEYFRGSYTTGVFASGELTKGLQYKVMLGNNLSQLGVSASQMDDTMDTFAAALWWMPTTGEFGKTQGFGDYEQHEFVATRLGWHYTHSTEEKESQPGVENPENTQVSFSDGTNVFDPGALGAGIQLETVRYQTASFDAGVKYQGFALEGEYFWRYLDQFRSNGDIGFNSKFDHGYQVQASMMAVPKTLQLYLSHSKIYGDYGNPGDVSLGVNWFPLKKTRGLRVNVEAMYLDDSPVGYSSVPFAKGGNGMVFVSHLELRF